MPQPPIASWLAELDASVQGSQGFFDGKPLLLDLSKLSPAKPELTAKPPEDAKEDPPEPATLLLDRPVRSGQSIIFTKGDVTVMGSIASGAEVIAGGSIHIYGALLGRAMAGVMGNAKARIFCNRFDPELVAINGLYATVNVSTSHLCGRPVQAWLDEKVMQMKELS
ncbi:MAG: septum site-determining protein MinC [Alphaproteobacteria bacterium]